VPELPRLDDLVGFANARGDHTDGILYGDTLDGSGHQSADELQGIGLLRGFFSEPSRSANGQMSAGRMRDHQIPRAEETGQKLSDVSDEMLSGRLAAKEIAGPRIMTGPSERIPNDTGKLARYKDSHTHNLRFASWMSSH
jgi:hypothetical protein